LELDDLLLPRRLGEVLQQLVDARLRFFYFTRPLLCHAAARLLVPERVRRLFLLAVDGVQVHGAEGKSRGHGDRQGSEGEPEPLALALPRRREKGQCLVGESDTLAREPLTGLEPLLAPERRMVRIEHLVAGGAFEFLRQDPLLALLGEPVAQCPPTRDERVVSECHAVRLRHHQSLGFQ